MRILQALAGAPHGGAERFFERLVPALAETGIEQRVLLRSDARRQAALEAAGVVDLHPLRFGNRLDLLTRLAFRRQVRAFDPDIVFSWMSRATAMAPKSPLGRHRFVRVARLGGYYDLKYYRDCDFLVGDTEAIVDYLTRQGWPAERAVYLPNFVDSKRGTALSRAELQVPAGVPLLLGLGRLHPNKGYDILIDALAQLPGPHLLLAGAGPERNALHRRAAERGVAARVHFLGWRDDLGALMASADLFVHPARQEPLGNVILEAWAHGRPVVASAADGPRSLIEDGVTGLLAPIEQPLALANRIAEALADPAAMDGMAAAGLHRYRRDFSRESVVGLYCDFFRRIAGTA
jgi:glycosyltransferase involved in cell wall biosynthesis